MYYIKRHEQGILVRDKYQTKILPTSLKKYVNQLCINNMATYDGRVTAMKQLFLVKKNVPIYVHEDLILYPTKSLRDYNTVLVNFFAVVTIKKESNGCTRFIFTNLEEEIIEVSYQKIMKQHSKIKIIIEYLNNRSFL